MESGMASMDSVTIRDNFRMALVGQPGRMWTPRDNPSQLIKIYVFWYYSYLFQNVELLQKDVS